MKQMSTAGAFATQQLKIKDGFMPMDDCQQALDSQRMADWLKGRRLETPAMLMLETLKPVQVLIYQFLVFSSPFMDILGLPAAPVVDLWSDAASVERLISKLEPI